MSEENRKTIEVYEKFGEKYLARNSSDIKNNPQARENDEHHRKLLEKYTEDLDKDAKIFEVGSASGRDAKTFQELGFKNITTSDVPDYFLNLLKSEGFLPIKFNLITDDFPEKYDFIYCWAVLVHFTKDEAKNAIRKMFNALEEGGRLALCVQQREGFSEDWVDRDGKIGARRYFSYWTEEELREFLKEVGFSEIEIEHDKSVRSNWLECIAKK